MPEPQAYDPTLYLGTAQYYTRGRPPYSRDLPPMLATELGLDGSGRLLDVGCGPGALALLLADRFAEVVGLDPDPDMLAEAGRRASEQGVRNVRWVQGRAEDAGRRVSGRFGLVTFGQSFRWTDRMRAAELAYEALEPGGWLALIGHQVLNRPCPAGPAHPPIPHDVILDLLDRYLGPERRAGQGQRASLRESDEEVLSRTRFGPPRRLFAPGRPDVVRDVDGVLAGYYSMSYAAPHLFGADLAAFDADVRAELHRRSATGLFWDWPGDTEVILARRPQ